MLEPSVLPAVARAVAKENAKPEHVRSFHPRLLQKVPVAVFLIFRAVTKQSYSSVLSEMLEQPQGELLTVVLDPAVSRVDRAALAHSFR